MLNRDLIKENVIRLTCGSKKGTAYLVNNNTAITASHCITEHFVRSKDICLEFLNLENVEVLQTTGKVISNNNGIAFIQLNENIEIQHLDMAVLNSRLDRSEKMITYGYPSSERENGWILDLLFSDDKKQPELGEADWRFRPASEMTIFRGFSGSPLIYDDKIVGTIITQNSEVTGEVEKGFSVNAISNQSMAEYLRTNGIDLKEIDYQEFKRQKESYRALRNIPSATVGVEVNRNNYNSNSVVKMLISPELRQEFESEYQEKIEMINHTKQAGKIKDAWTMLRNCISKIKKSALQDDVLLAKFYYLMAIWYLEDKSDGSNAQKYYNKAVELNPNIDTRIYIARKRYLEGTCINVLDILSPLDNISILNTYLQLCVFFGECDRAIEAYDNATFETNENTFYMMSLIYILKHDLDQAEQYIDMALELSPDVPIYHMMKGVIYYWNIVPTDLVTKQDLLPLMFETRMVHVSESELKLLDEAILCYQKAYNLAKVTDNNELIKMILIVWLDSLCVSSKHIKDSLKVVETIIEIDPFDPKAIIWKCQNVIDIAEYNLTEFEGEINKHDNKIGIIIALVNLSLANNDKKGAAKYLSKYKYEFNRLNVLEYWFDLRIRAIEAIEEIDKVESLMLKSSLSEDYKKRFRGVILERKNSGEELIDYAVCLYEETGLRIDLINLIHSCDKFKDWSRMEKYALILATKYSDDYAMSNVIKAQLMQRDWERCLESIEEYEKEHQLNEEIKFYKAQAYKVGRKYSDAIEEAENLWRTQKTLHVLQLLAECYFLNGQGDDAVSKLKEGVSQGIREPEIYVMLAEHLKLKSARDAKKFALKAYRTSNESKDVMLWCIHFLYEIGESGEAGVLLSQYQIGGNIENDKNFRAVPVKEALVIIEEMKKQNMERLELYSLSKIPYHLWIDTQNKVGYSRLFWDIWKNNTGVNIDNFPLYAVFGAHNLSTEEISTNIKEELILDYSVCIFLHELDLLKCLATTIKNILVSGNIFKIISKERLFSHTSQIDLKHNRQDVMERSQEIKINYHKFPDREKLEQYDNKGMSLIDIINYEEARSHQLIWIEENLSTEILGDGEKVLNEVRNAAVHPAEFLEALVRRGILSQEAFERYNKNDKNIREEIVEYIVNLQSEIKIFVDFEFLETLYELNSLISVSECCELHAFDNIFELIIQEKKEEQLLNEIQNKLESLQEDLLELKDAGIVNFMPYIETENRKVDEREALVLELKDSMLYCDDKKIPLVCNDRMVLSYNKMGGVPLISGGDIVEYLYMKKAITSERYFDTIKMMLDKNVCYFVPSTDYMKFALKNKSLNDDQENSYLISVRRYMQRITRPDSALMKTSLKHVMFPEVVDFMRTLQNSCMSLLKWIWEQENTLEWKQIKSNWLVNYFSEFGYAFSFVDEERNDLLKYKAVRIAEFIFKGTDQIINKQSTSYYYKWLFRWLKPFFLSEPQLEYEVVSYLGHFLEILLKENEGWDESKKIAAVSVLLKALRQMPEDFSDATVNHAKMREILEKYTKGVTVLNSELRIPDDIFNEWIEASMAAGFNHEITRDYESVNYKITFLFSHYYIQGFNIKWKIETKEEQLVYTIAGASLASKNNLIRVKGFNKIEDFLAGDIKKVYAKKVQQSRNLKDVEEIVNLVDQSSRFWLAQLAYIFDIRKDHIFNIDDLFPIYRNVFIEFMCDCNINQSNMAEVNLANYNLYELLDIKVKLPMGAAGSTFVDFIKVSVESEAIEPIIRWCDEKIQMTQNPVELINLLAVFYEYDRTKAESIMFSVLEGDRNKYDLFVELTKYAYSFVNTLENYNDGQLSSKLLYCYLFAGIVSEKLILLNEEGKSRYTIDSCIDWFSKMNDKAGLKKGYLDLPSDEDVSSPSGINKITITATALCNFIIEKEILLEDKDRFQQYFEMLFLESHCDTDLYLEFLLSDKERPNTLQFLYSGSLFELMTNCFELNSIDLSFEGFIPEPDATFSMISQKADLDIKDYVFLFMYSKDFIKSEWKLDIEKIINNYSILENPELRAGKFHCIVSILQKCSDEYQQDQMLRFRKELKHILLEDSKEFINENISTLEEYCVAENKGDPFEAYLSALEEFTKYKRMPVNKKFMDMFSAIQSRLEGEQRKRANLLRYKFEW